MLGFLRYLKSLRLEILQEGVKMKRRIMVTLVVGAIFMGFCYIVSRSWVNFSMGTKPDVMQGHCGLIYVELADELELEDFDPDNSIELDFANLEVWPQVDPDTGEITNNDGQIRVLEHVSDNSSHLKSVPFTTERLDIDQLRGVVHFIYEDRSKATNDVEVYFYPGQCAVITVPYVPGYYSDRPIVWGWIEFDVTIEYTEQRPPCCVWDDCAYYELRSLVPGQYQ